MVQKQRQTALAGVAASVASCSTEDSDWLASDGLSLVLEMEESNSASREIRY